MKPRRRIVLTALTWMASAGVWGAEFLGHAEAVHGNLAIRAVKPLQNVYAAASTVALEPPAQVGGDFYAAGREVLVDAPVGRNAHLAGLEVGVGAPVAGDLISIAQTLEVLPKAKVAGDLIAAGLDVKVEGPVQGRSWIAGRRVNLDGPLGGDATVRYDQSLVLGPGCRLKGRLECRGPSPPQLPAGFPAGQMDYQPVDSLGTVVSRLNRWTSVFGFPALLRLAGWLLAAWVAARCFQKPLASLLRSAPSRFWADMGSGSLVLLAAAAAIPVLFLILVGYYLSLTAGALLLAALLVSRLLAVFYLGLFLRKLLEKKALSPLPFRWAAAGILVLHLSGLAPFLGRALSLGLTLAALGGIMRLAGYPLFSRKGRIHLAGKK
jgi:hypothetical protein